LLDIAGLNGIFGITGLTVVSDLFSLTLSLSAKIILQRHSGNCREEIIATFNINTVTTHI